MRDTVGTTLSESAGGETNGQIAASREADHLPCVETLGEGELRFNLSPRLPDAERRVDDVPGQRLLELSEDRFRQIAIVRNARRVLKRQAPLRRFAVREQVDSTAGLKLLYDVFVQIGRPHDRTRQPIRPMR